MTSQDIEALKREARAAEDDDRVEEARRLLEQAHAKQPDDYDVLMGLARVLRTQLQFGEAAKLAREAARVSNGGRDALLELATNLRRDFQCGESLGILERLLEADSTDVDVRAEYGRLLCEVGYPDRSYEIFQQLIKEQPGEEDHRVGLAGALVKLGRHREALTTLEPILAASPDYVRAQLWATEACFGLHHYKEAARYVVAAYDVDDTWALVHYWAARLAAASNDQERRGRELNEALRLQSTCFEARIQLAYLWWRQGRLDDAFKLFRHTSETASWSGAAEAAFVEFMLEEKRGEPDLEHLEEQAKLRPYSRIAYYLGGMNQRLTGDLDASRRLLRFVVEKMPDDVDAWLALGHTLLVRDECEEAIQSFLRVVDLVPREVEGWRGLGIGQQNAGYSADAAKSYRQAISHDPEDRESHHGLGMVLIDLGQLEAAVLHLRRAVELQPDNGEFHLSLAEALERKGQADQARTEAARARELLDDPSEAEKLLARLA